MNWSKRKIQLGEWGRVIDELRLNADGVTEETAANLEKILNDVNQLYEKGKCDFQNGAIHDKEALKAKFKMAFDHAEKCFEEAVERFDLHRTSTPQIPEMAS